MKPETILELCEAIFRIEAEHDLLDRNINGVKLWQYLRMPIYYHIAEQHRIISSPHPNLKKGTVLQKLNRFFSSLKSSILHHPYSCHRSPDILLVDHRRSKKLNDNYVDIYTHNLINKLIAEDQCLCIIEKPENGKHLRKPSTIRKHLDILSFYRKTLIITGKFRPSRETIKEIKKLDDLLINELNLDSSLHKILVAGYINYKTSYRFWYKVLKKQQPKKVMVVVSYIQLGGLIKAAKDLGINIYEIQHGVFSRFHLGYSFPNRNKELDYFPTHFLGWGKYWGNLIDFPIPNKNIINFGFEYFHQMKEEYSNVIRNKNQILILSQGVISETLPKKLLLLSEELSKYQIIYKLHPSEYDTWKQNSGLLQINHLGNFEVIDYDCDLYQKFATSEYQFGVFSTAIFEGIGMGCKTILFNLQGIEYMDKLIKSNLAILHDDNTSIEASFQQASCINMSNTIEMLFGTHAQDAKISEYIYK